MKKTLQVLWQITRRDLYVYRSRIRTFFVNEIIIRPFCMGIAFGYLLPRLGFTHLTAVVPGMFFVGTLLWVLNSLSTAFIFDFWIDLDSTKHSTYQLSMVSPFAYIAQKIVCGSSLVFLCVLPIFPAAQLFLGFPFTGLTIMRLPLFLGMLWLATVLVYSFCFVALLFVHHLSQMRIFWRRVMHILSNLGGVLVPHFALAGALPMLALATYVNPFMYVTEGMRQALLCNPLFFPLSLCIPIMLLFIAGNIALAHYKLVQRLDPVID